MLLIREYSMNFPEYFPSDLPAKLAVRRAFVAFDVAVELSARAAGLSIKCLQGSVAFGRQAVAPSLRSFENRFVMSIRLPEHNERRADGFGIDISHDFANQLFLPSQCPMRRYSPGFTNLFNQVFVRLDRVKLLIAKQDELFAQCL